MFDIGQEITWQSQSGGYLKTKVGKILDIVPVNQSLRRRIPDGTPRSRIKFDSPWSLYERIIVAVPRGRGIDYYAPDPSVVEAQMRIKERKRDRE